MCNIKELALNWDKGGECCVTLDEWSTYRFINNLLDMNKDCALWIDHINKKASLHECMFFHRKFLHINYKVASDLLLHYRWVPHHYSNQYHSMYYFKGKRQPCF